MKAVYFFKALLKMIFINCLLFSCMDAAKEAGAAEKNQDLLYRAKCASCHRVYPPQKYTYQKFQNYVARYGKSLTDEERRRLLEYLKENAKQERGEEVKMGND